MQDLPDLPQLEKVETVYSPSPLDNRMYSNRFLGWTACAVLGLDHLVQMVLGVQRTCSRPAPPFALKLEMYVTLAVLLVLIVETLFIRVYKWSTDEQGIIARKLLWSKYIRWADVREVRVTLSSLTKLPSQYELLTYDGSMCLSVPTPIDRQYAVLLCSVRQHLKRFDKAGEMEIPESVQDLWWRVPDSVPREVSWINRQKPEWRSLQGLLTAKAVLLLLVLAAAVSLLGWHKASPLVVLLTLTVGGVLAFLWHYLQIDRTTAVSAQVDDAEIRAETSYGAKTLRWEDVRSAAWANDCLKLSGPRATLRIPDQGSATDLLLASLRNLRGLKKFECVEIPEGVRKAGGVVSAEV